MKIVHDLEKNMEITEMERFWGQKGLEPPRNQLKLKFGRTPPAAPAAVIFKVANHIVITIL